MNATAHWDQTVDVIVVGTGGAALTAALAAADGGAEVLVLEKDNVIGGTTGVSGGVMWVPNNRHLAANGLDDTRQDAIDYLSRIADGRELDPSLIEVFVDSVVPMLEFLEASTPLKTQRVVNLIDYYAAIRDRIPGCKPFSRSVEPLPYAARDELGQELADQVAARSTLLSLGSSTTLDEDLSGAVAHNSEELARRERAGIRVKGAALVSCMVKGLVDLAVEIRTSMPVDRLVTSDDGDVLGIVTADGTRIGARRGVILACGGFEWNADMVAAFIGYEVKPLSPGGNTGDGHRMAMEIGARLGNMNSYWGQGAMFDPAITTAAGDAAPQMVMGLGPGSVIVNQQGRQFMTGGYTYNDFPKPFGNFDQEFPGLANKPPAYVVFGSAVKDNKTIMTIQPGDPAPDWVIQANSIRELAIAVGIEPDALEATINTINSDPDVSTPITGPTYYAIQQWPGSIGTNGGLRINEHGQVLGYRHDVISGLYSAGNTTAAVLGGAYVGGGTPISVGATFGFLAGRHAAAQPPRSL